MKTRLLVWILAALAWISVPAAQPEVGSTNRSGSAARPVRRSDPNSLLAHEQLVQKAKRGGIDVYFVGDSITRRWGATDPQYRPLLENWRTNFFGWNAANFGWGADRIENILWRLQNGELDDVNPKVIVVLAGINNVGTDPGGLEKVEFTELVGPPASTDHAPPPTGNPSALRRPPGSPPRRGSWRRADAPRRTQLRA